MSGWYKTHRDMIDHPVVGVSKPLWFAAWSWMLSKARTSAHPISVKGQTITLERGELLCPRSALMAAVGMSDKQARTFLARLEREGMCQKTVRLKGQAPNVVTICNYDIYQSAEVTKGQAKGQARAKQGPSKGHQDKNIRIKEGKKDTPLPPSDGFGEFWEIYPHRNGKKTDRPKCNAKYDAAIKSGVHPNLILSAATAYRSDPDVIRGYGRAALTWLNNNGWDDEQAPNPVETRNEQSRPNSPASRNNPADRKLEIAIEVGRRASAAKGFRPGTGDPEPQHGPGMDHGAGRDDYEPSLRGSDIGPCIRQGSGGLGGGVVEFPAIRAGSGV